MRANARARARARSPPPQLVSLALWKWRRAATVLSALEEQRGELLLAHGAREDGLTAAHSEAHAARVAAEARLSDEVDKLRNKTERNAQNFIKLWMGRAVLSAFSGWVRAVAIGRLTRQRAARFIAMRVHRRTARVLRALRANARDEARARFVLKRVRMRWTNAHLWKTFNAWWAHAADARRARSVVARFEARWANLTCLRAYNAWLAMCAERARLRRIVGGVLGRMANGRLIAGFRVWKSATAAAREAAMQKWLVEEKLKGVLARLRARVERAPLARGFTSWRAYLAAASLAASRLQLRRDRVRVIVRQALRRMDNAWLTAAVGSWRRAVARFEAAEAERRSGKLRMTFIWATRRLTNARVTPPLWRRVLLPKQIPLSGAVAHTADHIGTCHQKNPIFPLHR